MKKNILPLIAVIFLVPIAVRASSFELGGVVRYTWWERQVNEEFQGNFKPGLQYGASLKIGMSKNMSFSSLFYYGNYVRSWWSGNDRFARYDSESALSYSATKYLSIFAGFIFSRYNLPMRWPYLLLNARYRIMVYDFAPDLGINFNVRLVQDLYLAIRTSVYYCNSREQAEKSWLAYMSSTGVEFTPLMRMNSIKDKIGLKTQLQLSYYITKINTELLFGCRYQYASIGSRAHGFKAQVYEHQWGIMGSASYRFSLTTAVPEDNEDKGSPDAES